MPDLPAGRMSAAAESPEAIASAPLIPEQGSADHRVTSPLDPEVLRRRWELVLPHREQMLTVARRRVDTAEDAEDVVTTALIRTVEHPRLDESRVGAFLCTTVMRLAVDVHRDRARQLAAGSREATRATPCAPVEESLCDEAEARWLADQLQDLPDRERQVLQARLSGMTAQQASAHLGLSPKATENAYTRVRHRAQSLLAATLAGIGILLGAGRRFTRPDLALVPVAVGSALALAVVALPSDPQPRPPTPQTPIVLEADRQSAVQKPDAATPAPSPTTSDSARPSAPAAPPSPTQAATSEPPTSPDTVAPEPRSPAPTRTQVTAPPVVDEKVVDPGGMYTEPRHTDETFEESLQRCLDNVNPAAPLTDPCG